MSTWSRLLPRWLLWHRLLLPPSVPHQTLDQLIVPTPLQLPQPKV